MHLDRINETRRRKKLAVASGNQDGKAALEFRAESDEKEERKRVRESERGCYMQRYGVSYGLQSTCVPRPEWGRFYSRANFSTGRWLTLAR